MWWTHPKRLRVDFYFQKITKKIKKSQKNHEKIKKSHKIYEKIKKSQKNHEKIKKSQKNHRKSQNQKKITKKSKNHMKNQKIKKSRTPFLEYFTPRTERSFRSINYPRITFKILTFLQNGCRKKIIEGVRYKDYWFLGTGNFFLTFYPLIRETYHKNI